MPRGNDAKAAHDELKERYEGGYGSAEDVMRAARASRPPELQAASLKSIDEEATAKLKLSDVAKKAKVDEVASATVRGDDVVYATPDGYKGVLVGGKDNPEVEVPHLDRLHADEGSSKGGKSKD